VVVSWVGGWIGGWMGGWMGGYWLKTSFDVQKWRRGKRSQNANEM
jgi:hypothetical protein